MLDLACGFEIRHNVGAASGFQYLIIVDRGLGSDLDHYNSIWGAIFVHELPHVFGNEGSGFTLRTWLRCSQVDNE